MAIALDTERQSFPNVRHRAIGQEFVGMVVDRQVRDRKKYGTDEVEIGANGKPRKEEVVTLLVMEGTTAPVGKGEDDRDAVVGETVKFIVKGRTYGAVIDARKKLDGVPMVGDVVRTRYREASIMHEGKVVETLNTNEEVTAKRLKGKVVVPELDVKVRRAKPDEAALVAKAEQTYHQLHNEGVALAAPAAASTVDPDDVW